MSQKQLELVLTPQLRECLAALDEKDSTESFQLLHETVQCLPAAHEAWLEQTPDSASETALLDWFKAGGGYLNENLSIASYGTAGRGFKASQALPKDAVLIRVPASLLITEDTAASDPVLVEMTAELTALRNPATMMAMFVLKEMSRTDSKWGPYLRSLPRAFSTPLHWTFDELLLLRGSPAFGQAQQVWKTCVKFYILVQHVFGAAALEPPSYAAWRWAFSVVMTRRNAVPVGREDEQRGALALIPVWDMGNHAARGQVTTGYDVVNAEVVSLNMQDVAADGQVFMHYGPRTNGEMLVNNGFLPADADENESDMVLVRLVLNPNDPLFAEKKAMLGRMQMGSTTIDFAVGASAFGATSKLLSFARVARLTQLDAGVDPSKPISAANEADACDVVKMAVTISLRKMEMMNLHVDRETYHTQCAVRLRRLEHKLLLEYLNKVNLYCQSLITPSS